MYSRRKVPDILESLGLTKAKDQNAARAHIRRFLEDRYAIRDVVQDIDVDVATSEYIIHLRQRSSRRMSTDPWELGLCSRLRSNQQRFEGKLKSLFAVEKRNLRDRVLRAEGKRKEEEAEESFRIRTAAPTAMGEHGRLGATATQEVRETIEGMFDEGE